MGMSFDIDSTSEYLNKLQEEWDEYNSQQDSSGKAITAFTTSYHLIEWFWGERISKDPKQRSHLGVRNLEDFKLYCRTECPELEFAQDIANGTKHFKTNPHALSSTKKAGGWDETPWDVAPWDETSLLLELKNGQWVLARDALLTIVTFWKNFEQTHLAP